METAAGLVKLKPNTKVIVEEWKSTLQKRTDEAIATLKDEGVQIESWFEIEVNGELYLLWYMRAESISKVWDVAARSKHDIDAYHFKIMSDITAPDGEIPATAIMNFSYEATST